MDTMTGYRKIDMAAWPRREHYQYYTEKIKNRMQYDGADQCEKSAGFLS